MAERSGQAVRIESAVPENEAAFRTGYETFLSGAAADRDDPVLWTYAEVLAEHRQPEYAYRRELFVAYRGDVPVGAGRLELPLRENRALASFEVAVPPEHRGAGVGAALFAHVTERARAEGRTSLLTELFLPLALDRTPGTEFAVQHGFTCRNTEVRRALSLPVAADRLDTLAARAEERASAYELRSWTGPCPEDYAAQYARLKGLLMSEAPTGSLDYEPETWDVERLREDERRLAAQERTSYISVAIASDGRVAAHTQAVVPGTDPGRAFQWDTLVLPEHRGHRLGLALKVANLRRLQAAHPGVTSMNTWNAEQNGPMIAVNEELGFRPVERLQEWQGPVPG